MCNYKYLADAVDCHGFCDGFGLQKILFSNIELPRNGVNIKTSRWGGATDDSNVCSKALSSGF